MRAPLGPKVLCNVVDDATVAASREDAQTTTYVERRLVWTTVVIQEQCPS